VTAKGSLCVALLAGFVITSAAAQSRSLFASLDGAWNGSGRVRLDNGRSERIKCKGYYNAKAGGAQLGIAIDCANAAVRINMRANLTDAAGKVSGTWEEREYNQSGNVTGSATADKLTLTFAGGLTGTLSIAANGSTQTVSISTGGPGFVGADLQFSKG
jgi:hypothetical protein